MVVASPQPEEKRRGYIPEAENENWGTPINTFIELDDEFHFNLDAAASDENTNCEYYWTKEQDALVQSWFGRVFLNPPYGRLVGKWVEKARQEVDCGNAEVVVMLLKATTDVKWWHKFVWDKTKHCCRPGVSVRFPEGRLCFDIPGKKKGPAPFPSAIIIFRRPE